MKIKKRTADQRRRDQRRRKRYEASRWQFKYAWLPVRADDEGLIWLEPYLEKRYRFSTVVRVRGWDVDKQIDMEQAGSEYLDQHEKEEHFRASCSYSIRFRSEEEKRMVDYVEGLKQGRGDDPRWEFEWEVTFGGWRQRRLSDDDDQTSND